MLIADQAMSDWKFTRQPIVRTVRSDRWDGAFALVQVRDSAVCALRIQP
jgi:hypothetical protein